MSGGALPWAKATVSRPETSSHPRVFIVFAMADDILNPDTAEMKARLRDIQERRRDRIRWNIGKHTAELAIAALTRTAEYRPSGKRRRRKRAKRVL